MSNFKNGDIVTWSSQSGGNTTTKIGTVVGVIPTGVRPSINDYPALYKSNKPGFQRDHESYIIEATNGKTYWPRVVGLQLVETSKKKPSKKSTSQNNTLAKRKYSPKNVIGLSLDFSGSMNSISQAALRDYNSTIESIRSNSITTDIPTRVFVDRHSSLRADSYLYVYDQDVNHTVPMYDYNANGHNTRLWDSVNRLITEMQGSVFANDPDTSFIIMCITDGQDNASLISINKLMQKIVDLQSTDRWSFIFRVPRGGYKNALVRLGIPSDNILEWETNSAGMNYSTNVTNDAYSAFYNAKAQGAMNTRAFYTADLQNVSSQVIKSSLNDISKEVNILNVNGTYQIRDFCQDVLGHYMKGSAFYKLQETEKVQDYKKIAVVDKRNGKVYVGREARQLMSLPEQGEIKLKPGNTGDYDVYIQSTSVNRKLSPGDTILYWKNAVN